MTTNTNAASSIMELIDAYAESRHVNGAPHYNAKTAEARAAVAAALASPGAVAAPDEEAARALNGAVRAEIVELLGCMGRKHLVDAAKTGPLVDVIGLLFSELSENDSEAQALRATGWTTGPAGRSGSTRAKCGVATCRSSSDSRRE